MDIPEKFPEVVRDFLADLSVAFPEYVYLWADGYDIPQLYQYCLTMYPERFFDILYQNEDVIESESNMMFLPNVDFRMLLTVPGISNNTKQAIWKYLQLILVTIMGNVKSAASFGDTAGLFEGIEEEELQKKLGDTIEGLTGFFKGLSKDGSTESMEKAFEEMFQGAGTSTSASASEAEGTAEEEGAIPNADDLHNHIKGLFDGKIGKLAKELAEELSGDVMNMFDDGTGRPSAESATTADILKKMMKNPKKIMELVKKIGTKLDDKMKTGDVSQEEIMKEVGELMTKMKGSGQGKDFEKMMKTMMKGMGLGDAGLNMGKMSEMVSKSSHKERMLAKLEARRQAAASAAAQAEASRANVILEQKDAPNEFVFKVKNDDGFQEKSRAPVPPPPPPPVDDWLDEPAPTKSQASKSSKSQKGKKGKK
jgi:hypothetical protein